MKNHHPSPTQSMKIYHYTDVTATKAVLENKKLWLTDIRYLNDHSEYLDGEKKITSEFERHSSAIPPADGLNILNDLQKTILASKSSHTFICSFSRGEDQLSQWRGYCPQQGGYALEFEFNDLRSFPSPLHDCVYEDTEKSSSAKDLFDFSVNVNINKKGGKQGHSKLFQATWSNIAKFKNAGFLEGKKLG